MRCVKKQQDTKKNLDFVLYVEKRPAGRRQEGTGSDRRIEKEDSGEEEEEEVIISFEEDGREEKEHLKKLVFDELGACVRTVHFWEQCFCLKKTS